MIVLKILLLLLKIIGILLLSVIGLVLLLLCIILFVPIRYNVEGSFYGKVKLEAKVSFLLKAVRAKFVLDGKEMNTRIKVLWFDIGGENKTKKNKNNKANKKKKTENQTDTPKGITEEKIEDIIKEDETENEIENEITEEVFPEENQDSSVFENEDNTKYDSQGESSAKEKKKKKKQKHIKKEKKPKREKSEKKDSVLDIKENKKAIDFILKKIKKLFKHVLPGTHRINLHIGFGDPALLGEIIGAVSVVRAMTNLIINVNPDFENKVFEADFKLKGRIRIGTILFIAASVYFNKDVKKLINIIKD